ncbi:MAG: cyanophycin synthetase [Candidatus Vogelbacteria bacterium]|nr:cyanophycin synthetase [Candidatus Vogelbacteria bacterium]
MEISKTSIILKSLEKEAGCKILLEPNYNLVGQISFGDNRKFYFRNTSLDINNFGAAEIAKDKDYTRFFMKQMGFKIPRGATFFSEYWCNVNNSTNNSEGAIKFASELGFPLIVKPNNKSQGEDVYKVYSIKQFLRVTKRLFKKHHIILIEEFVPGDDYRIVIFDNKAEMAYRRKPLSIIGDGKLSISELLNLKLKSLVKTGRHVSINTDDERIKDRLKHFYKIRSNNTPEKDVEIILLDNANLSTGGDVVEVTDSIHNSYILKSVELTKSMGLRFAGVDLITQDDITQPINNHKFIELNSSPGLSHFASLGQKTESKVKNLYLEILNNLKRMVI